MNNRYINLSFIFCLSFLLQSCIGAGRHATTMRDGLLAGSPHLSLAIAEKQDKQQTEVIASLDKGMLRRINGDYAGSNQILEVAKQEIKKLYGVSITENLAAIAINETLRGYEGDRYEQLLLHAYKAMNYIQLGELDEARVEMLQANVNMMEGENEQEEDAFVRYLEGIIYESLAEYDNALISYRKAYLVYKKKGRQYPGVSIGLKQDLLRLLAWQGLWSEYKSLKKEFNMAGFKAAKASKKYGTLMVILNNGLAPIRSETALHLFSPEAEKNLRVAFPVYQQQRQQLHRAQVSVGGKQHLLETVEDVDALARYSLEQAMPGIMARATARAVVKYNTQHKAEKDSPLAGFLMTVTNLITERADTRSWTTLPQAIELKRILLPAGEHNVQIQMKNAAGHTIDVINEKVMIKPKQTHFVIKHWNTPVPKTIAEKK